MSSIRREMIDSYIRQLQTSFKGGRPVVPEQELYELYRSKGYTHMAKAIKDQLGLNMRLRVAFVNSGGEERTPAWIRTPVPMPPYGTRVFQNTQIDLYIRRSFMAEAPFASVVAVTSHELAHVVLNATGNSLRFKEEAVDLTAMLLGYRRFFVAGCQYEVLPQAHPLRDPLKYAERLMVQYGLLEADSVMRVGYLTKLEVEYANAVMG